ncbi:MAG: hypothetical protein IPM64_14850 [Phycisphaerales bacterium]|nr:hypothetical protein [Phycisphaerales bacterium]
MLRPALSRSCFASIGLGMLLSASASLTAVGQVYSSGVLHTAGGGTSLTPVSPSRLRCTDGSGVGALQVELHTFSAWGGGVTADLTPVINAAVGDGEIKIKIRGWDGTIKGTCRVTISPGGVLHEEYDFTPIDAAAVRWALLDQHDRVIAEGTTAGPVISWTVEVPLGVDCNKCFTSAERTPGSGGGGGGGGGSSTAMREARQGFFDVAVAVSGLGIPPVPGVHGIVVSPEPCAGLPENCPPSWTDIASMELETIGIAELDLLDAHLGTFDVQCVGVGDAQMEETCGPGVPTCPTSERRLPVRNLGSSGEDGIEIKWPPVKRPASGGSGGAGGANGGMVAKSKRCPECPPGHVTLMKAFDDDGMEVMRMTEVENPATGDIDLYMDAAGMGSGLVEASFHGSGGALIVALPFSPTDSIHYAGGPGEFATTEWSGLRYRKCCPSDPQDICVYGSVMISGVESISIRPMSPTSPRAASSMRITSNDPEGIVIDSASLRGRVPGDMNCDGMVNNFDIDPFVTAVLGAAGYWAAYPDCDIRNGDVDFSGATNNFDIDPFVDCVLNSGCQ